MCRLGEIAVKLSVSFAEWNELLIHNLSEVTIKIYEVVDHCKKKIYKKTRPLGMENVCDCGPPLAFMHAKKRS